jgi:hypothetical protein|nr:MAG TPA_asm: hypothetical protein [Caudoviricetes sp.]
MPIVEQRGGTASMIKRTTSADEIMIVYLWKVSA